MTNTLLEEKENTNELKNYTNNPPKKKNKQKSNAKYNSRSRFSVKELRSAIHSYKHAQGSYKYKLLCHISNTFPRINRIRLHNHNIPTIYNTILIITRANPISRMRKKDTVGVKRLHFV